MKRPWLRIIAPRLEGALRRRGRLGVRIRDDGGSWNRGVGVSRAYRQVETRLKSTCDRLPSCEAKGRKILPV